MVAAPMTEATRMFLILDADRSRIQIWATCENYGHGPAWEFLVYGLTRSGDPRICPSLAMACELVGVDPRPLLVLAPFLPTKKGDTTMAATIRKGVKSTPLTSDATAPTRRTPREGTKQATLIEMLRTEGGATIDEIVAATGWQPHTIRGAMSGSLKKKLGLTISSEKVDGRGRVYRIAANTL